jgi:hypothetical protein
MAMIEGSYPFLAKKHGMHVNTLYCRVKKKGMSKEEACLMPVRTLDKQINTKIELMGFNPHTVAARRRKGETLDQALRPSRRYEFLDVEEVRRLANDGHKPASMAVILNRAESYMCAFCKKHGIDYKKKV